MSTERIEELWEWFNSETNDEETQIWRDWLTAEESILVDKWDASYIDGLYSVCKAIQDALKRRVAR